ncbi:MAG: glucose-1-phosphate cytidylyltransferase [Magnetococcales bacterium]|nr:glucose-1-phosphate cytidylyltransferase [Magnetococcales bacterium]
MKAVILAGGFGTRLAEETEVRPKPMVEIGGRPILWHIMKIYEHYGINDFVICLGYKGYMVTEYFHHYAMHMSSVTFDLSENSRTISRNGAESWKVTVVDTGTGTMTGGRLKRVRDFLGDEDFCMTYGDGVGSVNIGELIDFHKSKGTLATLTAVQPPGRFGILDIDDKSSVRGFQEKPQGDGNWISGGFFVLSPKVLDYISGDDVSFEEIVLGRLAQEGQLSAYHHKGFWRPMDTMRDKHYLMELWDSGSAPWKTWS